MIIEETDSVKYNILKFKDFVFDPLELILRVQELENRIEKLEKEKGIDNI